MSVPEYDLLEATRKLFLDKTHDALSALSLTHPGTEPGLKDHTLKNVENGITATFDRYAEQSGLSSLPRSFDGRSVNFVSLKVSQIGAGSLCDDTKDLSLTFKYNQKAGTGEADNMSEISMTYCRRVDEETGIVTENVEYEPVQPFGDFELNLCGQIAAERRKQCELYDRVTAERGLSGTEDSASEKSYDSATLLDSDPDETLVNEWESTRAELDMSVDGLVVDDEFSDDGTGHEV